jgi:hypothetical protein
MPASPAVPEPRVEVHLAIGLHGSRMAGELRVGDGAPRRFWSWLDLIAALDAARRGEDE